MGLPKGEKQIPNMEIIQSEMLGTPTLDVMIPAHNRLDLTMKCVLALYSHTQSPFHLIICDDSTDNLTPLYFKELITNGVTPLPKVNNITYIHPDEPFKEGNQFFNLALKYTKSDYLATVMNSIRVEPEWEIVAIQNVMKDNPQIGIIGFKCLLPSGLIESAGIKMMKYLPTDMGRDLPGHRLCNVYEPDAVQWAFALLRKKAILGNLEEGIFNGFVGWDDIDNCFQIKQKGWKVLYCGMGVGYHEPRATRGKNDAEAAKKNRDNGVKFYKRWGLWDEFVKENGENGEIHALPKIQ